MIKFIKIHKIKKKQAIFKKNRPFCKITRNRRGKQEIKGEMDFGQMIKLRKIGPFAKKQEIDGENKNMRGKWIWSNGLKGLLLIQKKQKNVILPLKSCFLKK